MSLYGFPKAEHLCGKNNFQLLFKEGSAIYLPSFKLVCRWVPAPSFGVQAGMVVSKRLFRHAVDRNRVKRLLREAYRIGKPAFCDAVGKADCQWQLLFVYTGHELPTFVQAQKLYIKETVKKNGADCTKV